MSPNNFPLMYLKRVFLTLAKKFKSFLNCNGGEMLKK